MEGSEYNNLLLYCVLSSIFGLVLVLDMLGMLVVSEVENENRLKMLWGFQSETHLATYAGLRSVCVWVIELEDQ